MTCTSHAESLVQEMDNALAKSSEDNDITCWNSFQQVVYHTAKASLGKHEKKHQDWFDPSDQILLCRMRPTAIMMMDDDVWSEQGASCFV